MVKYIYSTCFASFVFDNQFNLVEKALFKDSVKAAMLLEQGKDPEEAIKLKEKHHAQILREPDEKIAHKLREFTKEFHDSSILVAKQKLRHAFGADNFIIQGINNIDELNKAANMLSKRLREWFEIYCPEFSSSIEDHQKFAELITKKTREELLKEAGAKETIGTDMSKADLKPIMDLAANISEIYSFKVVQEKYIEQIMEKNFPNITVIAGALIGAKLIAIASGIKRLSEFPASTVQLLGAEKALFRHIKNKKYRSPKYGVIMQHPLIAQARKENKAKIARLLGDKLSIAAKVDYFKGKFAGKELMEQIRKRIKMLETQKRKERE